MTSKNMSISYQAQIVDLLCALMSTGHRCHYHCLLCVAGLTPVYRSYQNVPPQSMMESASNSPMMGSSFNQPYQGHSMGVPSMPPQQGSAYMGQQPSQQTQFASGTRYDTLPFFISTHTSAKWQVVSNTVIQRHKR